MLKTIIIGAGIAGLSAAKKLKELGHEVMVLEKSRGVGGRMATRTMGEAKADHGAQYFSVKSPEFSAAISVLQVSEITQEWQLAQRSNIRYIGKKGMNTVPKKMAENITIQLNEKVTNITKNQVFTESGNNYVFDYLLITIPIPQIIDLLTNANIMLNPKDEITFNTIQYEPCIAVMAILKKPTEIPTGGIMLENQPVGWIADNFQKGITTIPTVTIHATATYSQAHLDADLQLTARHLLSSVSHWISSDNIEDFQVHRWRYSLAKKRYSENFYQLEQHPIFLAGDGFGMGNIEGAFLSGLSAAKAIHSSK